MWILMIVFHTATFSIIFESRGDCLAFADINRAYWSLTEQSLHFLCAITHDI